MTEQRDVVVVGAGLAGVSAALALEEQSVRALVLDAADRVGASWHGRYDRLRLNSPRAVSHLAGRKYAKGTPKFPGRDVVAAHIAESASALDVRLSTEVERLTKANGSWTLATSAGDLSARQVVVATGHERRPLIPDWPGRGDFRGKLIHAAEYRNPEPYRGRKVLVVGSGCSGMEIAYDLADGGAGKVWMAVRTPPNIVLREGPGGIPGDYIALVMMRFPTRFADAFANFGRKQAVGDLSDYGLPVPEEGVFARLRRLGVAPAIVDMPVIEAIKAGDIEVTRGVESLDETGITLADGTRLEPDAVVCATGYERGLDGLVGHLGVLDDAGRPRATGERAAAPGLRFIGYVPQPSQLRKTAADAKRAARAIARELR